jgi:hypothetical protein
VTKIKLNKLPEIPYTFGSNFFGPKKLFKLELRSNLPVDAQVTVSGRFLIFNGKLGKIQDDLYTTIVGYSHTSSIDTIIFDVTFSIDGFVLTNERVVGYHGLMLAVAKHFSKKRMNALRGIRGLAIMK